MKGGEFLTLTGIGGVIKIEISKIICCLFLVIPFIFIIVGLVRYLLGKTPNVIPIYYYEFKPEEHCFPEWVYAAWPIWTVLATLIWFFVLGG
jgi:hypothetical protein